MTGVPPLAGDVLVPRGLRLPADHWGLTVVVCGKGTSSVRRYVLDARGWLPWRWQKRQCFGLCRRSLRPTLKSLKTINSKTVNG